ncbi:DUF302 domain-containing protein [Piscinibacter sakaiensis]|uniref:DUF302 domain-containing protein n=1 Tax=Piscinibacter sakaiensis TaxID=1547922 RepID=A0A0K8NV26_PISS1|nr:DUF302 domain-containing protein [Piscinibacter sakaiensis]GAP34242.1 hypothetical protein ISF6_4021 [Piscinibacter sakaiensis]|tara:strand:- start:22833 stop:23357 length:525 start_codon:yes stop_codon:yes gene_type:complete
MVTSTSTTPVPFTLGGRRRKPRASGRGVVRCHRLEYHCGNTRKFTLQDLAFGKTTSLTHDEAIARVTADLAKEGFGVLTEIDVAATMKKKLGLEMPPYRILGACNPQFAQRALEAEPQIGALLPCNVVVRTNDTGATVVEVMDPGAVLGLVGRPEITLIAAEVRSRLERVLRGV